MTPHQQTIFEDLVEELEREEETKIYRNPEPLPWETKEYLEEKKIPPCQYRLNPENCPIDKS